MNGKTSKAMRRVKRQAIDATVDAVMPSLDVLVRYVRSLEQRIAVLEKRETPETNA